MGVLRVQSSRKTFTRATAQAVKSPYVETPTSRNVPTLARLVSLVDLLLMFETDSSDLDRLLQELDTELELPTAAESDQQLQELLDSLPTTEQLLAELSDLVDAIKRLD
jgi:hypothetical protein